MNVEKFPQNKPEKIKRFVLMIERVYKLAPPPGSQSTHPDSSPVEELHRADEYCAAFKVEWMNTEGEFAKARTGDLIPHLTARERTELMMLLDRLWEQAEIQMMGGSV